MKAVVIRRFGDPSVLETEEVKTPDINDYELLVEPEAGSINPVDWKQRKGNHRFILGSSFPLILGYDVAGRVIRTGKNITGINEGDYVCGVLSTKSYGSGLAQFVKGEENCFAKVKPSDDSSHFAVLPLAGLTALQALRDKGNIRKDHKVLIIGAAGGVGHYALQIARIYGAEVTAVSSEKHRNFINDLGQFQFIDYTKEDFLRNKERYNIIYDCVGKHSYLTCLHLLLPGGTYINTLPRPKIILHKALSLLTSGKKVKTQLMKNNADDLNTLVSWVNEGKIRLCIDKEFSIKDIAAAHRFSEEGRTQGKILIRYDW